MKLSDLKKSIVENDNEAEVFDRIMEFAGIHGSITKQDTLEKVEDYIYELADGLVDIYNGDVLEWYIKDLSRLNYANDGIASLGGSNDVINILKGGQVMYWSELINTMIEKIKAAV